MRSFRPLTILVGIPLLMLWMLLANCGKPSNAPPPCSGQHDCAIDEQCYNNMCVRLIPPQDAGVPTDTGQPPPPTCQAGQCSSNGQCLVVSNAACGLNGSPCVDCSAQGGCNFGTGQCNGGGPPPPTCQANQCNANGQCLQVSNATCGLNGSPCTDCSTQGGCNFGTGQCNGGGPPPPTCQANQCKSNNQCVQVSNAACGANGSPCVDCSAQGGCNFGTGRCNGGGGNCNASNCQTCCQNGRCISVSEINDSACGARGVACDNCAARGSTCNRPAGKCNGGTPPPTCGPSNCVGCCQAGKCVTASNAACGARGSQCTDCSAKGGCNFSTGQCNGGGPPPTCGPTNCAGCCQNGQCVQPQQLTDFACGARGAQCTNCQSSGSKCNTGTGQCQQAPPSCGPATCGQGCCQNGQCITQVSDVACGTGGQACVSCSAQGMRCDLSQKRCQQAPPSCGPATCGQGCCQNGQCITALTDRACGGGGGICQNCSSTQVCDKTKRICVAKPQNQYPPSPYGTSVGSVMSPNIAFTECANSSGGTAPNSTKAVFNSQVKVVLLTVHAGW